jgi:prepilin-type N-terminal cleavage/methylation domain-containing protein
MRRSQAGLTLIEVMIASAIMAFMMMLSWRTLSGTHEARRTFEDFELRNHEVRVALGRVVADFEAAYLSRNEDQNASNPRTMFVARATGAVPEAKFSTLNHRVLWADANESEQTVIQYMHRKNKAGGTDWLRREQRRPSNQPFEDEPAEFDLLLANIEKVKIEYWNWKNLDWQDTWDTTQADGQRNWLPSRVRIAVTIKDNRNKDITLTTQARILMQEPLNFTQ